MLLEGDSDDILSKVKHKWWFSEGKRISFINVFRNQSDANQGNLLCVKAN